MLQQRQPKAQRQSLATVCPCYKLSPTHGINQASESSKLSFSRLQNSRQEESHCGDPGNETADRLAKEAVGAEKKHPFQHLLSREEAFIRNNSSGPTIMRRIRFQEEVTVVYAHLQ